MTTIEVPETGPGESVSLSAGQALALDESGFVAVRPDGAGSWTVNGVGKVGVARVGDVIVRVAPKLPIARIFYLLGYGRRAVWRDDLVPYDTEVDLVHVIAGAFARQADRALGRGVVHGYVEVDDELAVVRGRLRTTEQLTRSYGQITPLLVRYDEFTPDISENQLLKAAARVLLSVPGLDAEVARRLRVVVDRLADVSDLAPGAPLPYWRVDRRNTHYDVALWFAEMVLCHRSIDLPTGSVEINGFMVDMAMVFEDFVSVAFTAAFERFGGRVEAQDQVMLDHSDQVEMKPDLVWYHDDVAAGVVDAKYKAEKPAGYPNADVYQMLAYCTALGLPEGHLVYAKGAEEPAVHDVRGSGTRIVAHALDLDVSPDALLEQTRSFVETIAAGAPDGVQLAEAADLA